MSFLTIASFPRAIDRLVVDGTSLLATCRDGRLLKITDGVVEAASTAEEGDFPSALAVAPQKGCALVGYSNGNLDFRWSWSGKLLPFAGPFGHSVADIAVSPCERWVAAGGDNSDWPEVRVYDAAGTEVARLRTYKWVYRVAFSPDGARLAIGTWDGYLYVLGVLDAIRATNDARLEWAEGMAELGSEDFRPFDGYNLPYPDWHLPGLPALACVWEGEHVWVACERNPHDERDPEQPESTGLLHRLHPASGEFTTVVTSRVMLDLVLLGDHLVGGGLDGAVTVWDKNGSVVSEMPLPVADPSEASECYPACVEFDEAGPNAVFCLAADPDGRRVYVGTAGGRILEFSPRIHGTAP
jgi:hypothetical protein